MVRALTEPNVTIAMPVLNGGRNLRSAVESIMRQSYRNWELLILDDGSTDGAVAALELGSDDRVVVVHDGQNRGLAARLNQAIAMARSPYIARMDHDDIAHPDRLARQVEFLEANPEVDLVGTRCVTMLPDGQVLGELPFAETHGDICNRPWLGFYLPHPSWTARTAWFRRYRYADPAPYCAEDQELLLRARCHSRYQALDDYLMAYRVHTVIPFRKLLRTRLALFGAQRRQFTQEHRYGLVVLSCGALVARIAADVMRSVAPAMRSDFRQLSNGSLAAWQERIDKVQASR